MTSYFSHDSNARNNKKIIRLRQRHGAAGYGIYFMLLERLREEKDYTSETDYDMIAFDLRADAELIKSVVEDFDLFTLSADRNTFTSEGFAERMEVKDKVKNARSAAGKRGAENRWDKNDTPSEMAQNGKSMANAWQTDSKTMAIAIENDSNKRKEKKSKVKESKEDYYSFSSTSAEVGKEEQEEKQTLFSIRYVFFFRNWQNPGEEIQRLISWNSTNGRSWQAMTHDEKSAAADLWKLKEAKPPRFDQRFLNTWQKVVNKMLEMQAPTGVIDDALSDKLRWMEDDAKKIRRLVCTEQLRFYIEAHLEDFKDSLLKLAMSNGYKLAYAMPIQE